MMFAKYKTIFCDSVQALEYAYQNGLPKSAIVKSSAPAMLWDKKININNIEARWTTGELEKFQEGVQELTECVFDSILSIPGVEREIALSVTDAVYRFQKIIYKAACLDESDFTDPRLFIYVDGETGPSGNIMNSPWDQLLSPNPLFSMVNYTLKNDNWNQLTTHGISYWNRYKIAGFETIVYRLAKKIMKRLPSWLFTKELIVPNENELNIEIASSLALHGVRITELELDESFSIVKNKIIEGNIPTLYEVVQPIMYERIEEWVTPSAVKITMSLFNSHLQEQLKKFKLLVDKLENNIVKSHKIKQSVLMNAPGNIRGFALSYVCRKNGIPIMSSQHGVTVEISKRHSMIRYEHDNSVADVMFSYNRKIIQVEKNTHFNHAKHYSVGMPLRLMRMKYANTTDRLALPIVFISTNLYHMGFSLSANTDYRKARYEQKLITEVLSKLPHKVRYKTYPEDNRRYADVDPVLDDVKRAENMELFSNKIDMRYLLYKYKIFITTGATSTLGWPIMSDKPVVFINQKYRYPLTSEAYDSFSKGIFVFNDSDQDFHRKLRSFLSQPIDKIERLWDEKKEARKNMVRNYFSTYKDGGAGKRAAKIILREYLN